MAVNTQFSIAVHLLAGLGYNSDEEVTSATLAKSVNACPSFVRRVLAKLSGAHLVHTTTGKSGFCSLARKPKEITLLDIYKAVDAPRAFSVHDYPIQKACPVSCNIKTSLDHVLHMTQQAMEESLRKVSLADVLADLKKK